jgi:hypothetical protein
MKEIVSILSAVKESLPKQTIVSATEFWEHDEWGEALSLICTQLYEYNLPVSAKTFEMIKSTALKMQLPEADWIFVSELIDESE